MIDNTVAKCVYSELMNNTHCSNFIIYSLIDSYSSKMQNMFDYCRAFGWMLVKKHYAHFAIMAYTHDELEIDAGMATRFIQYYLFGPNGFYKSYPIIVDVFAYTRNRTLTVAIGFKIKLDNDLSSIAVDDEYWVARRGDFVPKTGAYMTSTPAINVYPYQTCILGVKKVVMAVYNNEREKRHRIGMGTKMRVSAGDVLVICSADME